MIKDLGLRCHDQRRFSSAAVTRAFVSVMRTSSQGSQSEVSRPDDVVLVESDGDALDSSIVRGVD